MRRREMKESLGPSKTDVVIHCLLNVIARQGPVIDFPSNGRCPVFPLAPHPAPPTDVGLWVIEDLN